MSASELNSHEFAESLPPEYRARFNPAQIAIHAHAAVSRQPGRVSAKLFPWSDAGKAAVCVIADDRPGLLADMSAAFAELGFDVDSAEAYTRAIEPPEAVDIFWLRDASGAIDDEQIFAFSELLEEFPLGRPGQLAAARHSADGGGGTTVRFLENARGQLSMLEVETDDRSGLLWSITHALFEQQVQIVSSRVRTQGGRVHDSFKIVELDGSPIAPMRRLAIQVALMAAIQPQLSPSAPPVAARAG